MTHAGTLPCLTVAAIATRALTLLAIALVAGGAGATGAVAVECQGCDDHNPCTVDPKHRSGRAIYIEVVDAGGGLLGSFRPAVRN